MAPGGHLEKDSPYGEDIQNIIREMLKDELSVMAWNNSDQTITIQLMLGEERVGKQLCLDINCKVDNGHGGGSYVDGLAVKWIT